MMKIPDPEKLVSVLTERFGIALEGSSGKDAEGHFFDFRPLDLHENEGFSVRTMLGWRSVRSRMEVGKFGAGLLGEMSRSSAEQKGAFAGLARSLEGKHNSIRFRINGIDSDPSRPETWPGNWSSLNLEIERSPVTLESADEETVGNAVLFLAGGLLGMIVALLRVEEIEETETSQGLPEGAVRRVEVNRYERNRVNRAICISVHGTSCGICGMNFEEIYGEIGRDFIHVHHVVPVSRLGPDYNIDPVRDLVPVCPNCHSMLHRRNPPLDVDELRDMMLGKKHTQDF